MGLCIVHNVQHVAVRVDTYGVCGYNVYKKDNITLWVEPAIVTCVAVTTNSVVVSNHNIFKLKHKADCKGIF